MAKKWRLPPLSWYKRQPPDRPVQECMREYYKLHPEHLPPRFLFSDSWADEARHGNPDPLIGYLRSAGALSPAAIDVIVEALEAKRGKRYRDVEAFLITQQVEGLIREEGLKQKQAVASVMVDRHCCRSYVYEAMREYKQRRRRIR